VTADAHVHGFPALDRRHDAVDVRNRYGGQDGGSAFKLEPKGFRGLRQGGEGRAVLPGDFLRIKGPGRSGLGAGVSTRTFSGARRPMAPDT
jgi:hypothetical protein